MSEWREMALDSVALINPTESLKKGTVARKIAMDAIQPFTKKPSSFAIEEYNGGMKFRNGDTIVARITPCLENGKTAYIDILEDGEVGFGSTEYIVIREREEISDKQFLYYFSISSVFRDIAILSMTGSSGRQRVQTEVVRQHIFELPPLPEQKAIATVLSSLDDKIDLLHRQNLTLEAMAETLFRQWFVAEVPADWEEGTLDDLVEFNYGKTLRDQERSGYGFPVYGSSGIVGYHNKYLVEAPGIITGRKGTLGVINYSFHNFFPIDTTFYITSKIKSDGLFFEYFLLKTLNLGEMNSDSAVPGLNKNLAHGIQLTIPPTSLIEKFNQQVKPLFKKLNINQTQIQTLESLRDTLLPKLMSGEVRVMLDA